MVARDGVERFGVPYFQQVADSMKDRKDTEDTKGVSCVRFVCDFSVREDGRNPARQADAFRSPGALLINDPDNGSMLISSHTEVFRWIH
jgi:hypothetical protein